MKYTLPFLIVFLLSCGQQTAQKKSTKNAIADSTATEATVHDSTVKDNDVDFLAGKAALDNMFLLNKDSATFSNQDMTTALLIGRLFDKEKKYAVFRYNENDSVVNVIVLRETGKNWDTIIAEKLYPASVGDWGDLIVAEDFNGDDIPDLKVVKEHWDIHAGESADLWLYSNRRFTKVKGFDKIVAATYDKPTNLIYAYQSMGCADMAMYFGVFSIVSDTVETVKEMYCDCCNESGDSCRIKVFGQEPFVVPAQKAYKYVPYVYAEGVKEKCKMAAEAIK